MYVIICSGSNTGEFCFIGCSIVLGRKSFAGHLIDFLTDLSRNRRRKIRIVAKGSRQLLKGVERGGTAVNKFGDGRVHVIFRRLQRRSVSAFACGLFRSHERAGMFIRRLQSSGVALFAQSCFGSHFPVCVSLSGLQGRCIAGGQFPADSSLFPLGAGSLRVGIGFRRLQSRGVAMFPQCCFVGYFPVGIGFPGLQRGSIARGQFIANSRLFPFGAGGLRVGIGFCRLQSSGVALFPQRCFVGYFPVGIGFPSLQRGSIARGQFLADSGFFSLGTGGFRRQPLVETCEVVVGYNDMSRQRIGKLFHLPLQSNAVVLTIFAVQSVGQFVYLVERDLILVAMHETVEKIGKLFRRRILPASEPLSEQRACTYCHCLSFFILFA